jgi:hypothetical protein
MPCSVSEVRVPVFLRLGRIVLDNITVWHHGICDSSMRPCNRIAHRGSKLLCIPHTPSGIGFLIFAAIHLVGLLLVTVELIVRFERRDTWNRSA